MTTSDPSRSLEPDGERPDQPPVHHAGAPAIVVSGLRKRVGSRDVLDGVTFSVATGEVFVLVGPNGAGKSTLTRILATLVDPDEGEVTIAGIRVDEDRQAVRRRIGYLPEAFGIYPRLTCEEYVEFYAGLHAVAKARRHELAGELLEVVGLADRTHDDVEGLSRGERQRLGLARTLVNDPQVLLLEEPAAGLDLRGQGELRDLFAELREMGKTILVSTNHASDLEGVATSMGLMEAGRMLRSGPVDDVALQEALAAMTAGSPG